MAFYEVNWETFSDDDDDEEALSLSDLPVTSTRSSGTRDEASNRLSAAAAEDFEFRSYGGAGGSLQRSVAFDMCAADEVFYGGQILPLRPSVSSDGGLKLKSRCESLDRHSSAASSLGFGSAGSSSISRSPSQSSGSASSANYFYARPSPSPRIQSSKSSNAGRRRTRSPRRGWALLRLGVAKAPEIELSDLRARANAGKRSARSGTNSNNGGVIEKEYSKEEKRATRLLGFMGCNCSLEAVETVHSRVLVASKKGKREQRVGFERGESMRHHRVFEWLEDL